MNGMVIVGLLSVFAVLAVFRLCTQNTSLSRAGLMMAAVVRAVIPLSAAVGIGSWQLLTSLNSIPESGRGARDILVVGAEALVRTLLAGVAGLAIALTLALILVGRRRAITSTVVGLGDSGRRLGALLGLLILVASLGATWVMMNWSERISVGMFVPLLRGGVFDPTPHPALATMPSTYAPYVTMSNQDIFRESERLVTNRELGIGLCVLFAGLSFATSAMFSGLRTSGAAWHFARGSIVVLVAVATWYSVHLGTSLCWLRTVIDR